jgi:uncharacterized protein YegP (UPF0339 family)
VPLSAETAMYAVLDVLAKVGFGFILLRSRAVLGDAGTATPAGGLTAGATPAGAGSGGGATTARTAASGSTRDPSGGSGSAEQDTGGGGADAEASVTEAGESEPMREPLPDGKPAAEWTESAIDYDEFVAERTVPEVREEVEERSLDAERVLEAERRGQARVTLIEWLEGRISRDTFLAGERSNARIELYEDRGGQFRWRLRHRNGHILADSAQGYASRRNVRRAIDRFREHADAEEQATFEIYEDKGGEWRWRLVHENGNTMADSGQSYSSKQGATRGVESVKRNAPGADAVAL